MISPSPMRIASLLLAFIILPAAVSAETFTVVRDVQISSTPAQPRMVLVELDQDVRNQPASSMRLINSQDIAVGFIRTDESKNLMPEAIFDAVPIAAGTAAGNNTVENLRDGSISTVFQPLAAESFRFRFHFAEPVAPELLEYTMDTANVSGVKVRIGDNFGQLHDAYVGLPSGTSIGLSGEKARAYEIIFTMRQGVPRIGEMKLLQPHSTLLFRAVPSQSYKLLYGGPERLKNPTDKTLERKDVLSAELGPVRRPPQSASGDHDGIAAGDNCPDLWNAEQKDMDGDVVGDVCDNCPAYPNSTQDDADGDGVGDVCEDPDRDGIANAVDNCSEVRNPAQQDEDKDGIGNACDNVDDRFTSGKSWLLWAGMTLIILILAGAGYSILKKTQE